MKTSRLALFAVSLCSLLCMGATALSQQAEAHETSAVLELQAGDTIALLGGSLAERMQHHGWLETRFQRRLPNLGLTFRNLGFSADELTIQQRTSGFGTWDEHLARIDADVIFAFFGFNESFAGAEGLADFRRDLKEFIEHTRAQRYHGEATPRLVLFSPLPFEDMGDLLLPAADTENRRLQPYALAMADVAAQHGVPFVDLFSALNDWRAKVAAPGDAPQTLNGMHLTEPGNKVASGIIADALLGELAESEATLAAHESLRDLVLQKNLLWFNRYRATDGYNVYGGRSSLTYDGVTNFDVLQHELVEIDALVANLDRDIQASARGDAAPEPLPVPAPLEVATNRPGPLADGAYPFSSGEEALAAMTAAPGMEVQLFADEARFPALVNPVQMSFDTQGRLWVATWATYPHWAPGQPMNDGLLILTDTDGDGSADTCEAFADDLHNPTGFEFWNGGVLVANPPDILFLKDTTGDGVADVRERVLSGLSSGDTHHSANSFVLGPDGALYFQEGTFHQSQVETIYGPVRNNNGCVWRFEPRTWRAQRYVPYGFANPHGHVFDAWGQDFVTDGTGNVNYYALPFSGYVEQGRGHGGYFPFFQQRSRPSAATEILSSGHFPEENQGNYLIANVIGFQGIFQYQIHDDGSGFSATEVEPLVHSSDPSFRPVDIEMGPDGAVYFLDWQNPIIGHMQHHLRDPSRDREHGRVYRVTSSGRELLQPVPIAGRPIDELLGLLRSDDDRVRYRVRIELSGRDSADVLAAVDRWVSALHGTAAAAASDMAMAPGAAMGAIAERTDDPAGFDEAHEHALLEALWVLQQHGAVDQGLLERVLSSPEPRARAAATRVLRWMRRDVTDPLDLLAAAVTDEHPRVRLEAVVALSEFSEHRAAELALLALSQPGDRFLDYALKETLATLAPVWKSALGGGDPFAADDPLGLSYALARLDSDDLLAVHPSGPLYREVLSRHGLPTAAYAEALSGLAELHGSAPVLELLDAIGRADARDDGHADHLLIGLFDVLAKMPKAVTRSLPVHLGKLAATGHRGSTRRLAVAAKMRSEGTAERAWATASESLAALTALLDAGPMVGDDAIAAELFPKVVELLRELPEPLATEAAGRPGITGSTVRIELPGASRTLTLAEVQVFSGADNVAPTGYASQSSVNWGGAPERALDGITSGLWGDGAQTHTMENQADPWWKLSLPGEVSMDRIVVWNRTDSDGLMARLDGFVLTILGEDGRATYRSAPQPAQAEPLELILIAPELALRRAAVSCLGGLGVRQDEAVTHLLAAFDDVELRGDAVAALSAIPVARWGGGDREDAARRLLALMASEPGAAFLTPSGRRLLALADHVGQGLDGALGDELSRTRRSLGPQIVVIRPVLHSLTYDVAEFTVQAGRPVKLLFDNVDIMPHNLLLSAPGSLATVGQAGEAMARDADAWERAFVPDLPEVLLSSGLLQPGQEEWLEFDAPDAADDYPFLCTFPGHWVRMNGVMHVVDELPDGPLVVRRDASADQ
ncbi:MAG: glucose/arabinose dehydrogenase/azurin/lysophospholipase L1-like esterase, partial [Pseudohongiellaceae bacterium]